MALALILEADGFAVNMERSQNILTWFIQSYEESLFQYRKQCSYKVIMSLNIKHSENISTKTSNIPYKKYTSS